MYEDISKIEAKYKVTDFPLNIIIEPSNFCNLNCITCANDKMTRLKGTIRILLYKKLIDEISVENPYTRIWLDYYGEPLLQRHRLYYLIDYARRKGLKNICLNTNGTLLDEEMAEMLLDSGIDFISIDCDGFSKEVYEKIRVRAKRDVLYKNIEYLLRRKKERGDKKTIIEVKIMEMKENKAEIQQVLDYWRERGAWTTKRRLISWAGKAENIKMDVVGSRVACGNAVGILAITWDGIATNCVMDTDAQYSCGDVNKETIKTIWQRRNEQMVKKHLEHKWSELPEICKNCNDWGIIGEERFDEKGNPIGKNYEQEKSML